MFSAELKKGNSEMLILALLEARPRHGYEIGKLIEAGRAAALFLPAHPGGAPDAGRAT
jgi:DNA-binding PadR family transcriptional regulator